MARLVSYKARDENRYSTFGGEVECNSSENLTETNRIKLLFKTKSPSTRSNGTVDGTNTSTATTADANQVKKKKFSMKSSKKCGKSMPSSSAAAAAASAQRVTVSTIASQPLPSVYVVNRNRPMANSEPASTTSPRLPTRTKKRWQSTKTSKSFKSKFNCCSFATRQCTRKRNCTWRLLCCCCCSGLCKRNSTDDDDDDDDDDIDAKFEEYKRQMKLTQSDGDVSSSHDASGCFDNNVLHGPEITFSTDHVVSFHVNGGDDGSGKMEEMIVEPAPSPSKSKRFRYRKYWNWNDSLRSNSDKFLETLEYDMDGENSLQRNAQRRRKGSFY